MLKRRDWSVVFLIVTTTTVAVAVVLFLWSICPIHTGARREPEIEKAWVTTCGITSTINDYGGAAPYRLSCITRWQEVPREE